MEKYFSIKLKLCLITLLVGLFFTSSHVMATASSMTKLSIYTGEGINEHFAYRGTARNFHIGDINGDGYPDIIDGARHHSPDGGVYIFFANQNLIDKGAGSADIILRDQASDGHLLGADIAVGDINNDGINEIIAGDYDTGATYGHGFIFKTGSSFNSRNTSLADGKITGLLGSDSSRGLEILGDVNGDGYKDFIYNGADDGNLYIFYGGVSLPTKSVTDADVVISSSYSGCLIGVGQSFGSEVDLNNDGYKDIVIGCGMRLINGGYGAVHIFYGGPSLLNKDISQADIILSAADSSIFKFGVDMAAGDINADGYQDLIVKDDHYVFVFFGSSNWTNKTTNQADVVLSKDPTLGGDSVGNYLKGGVTIGDINNDGYQDIVTAAYYLSKIYVFFGGPEFVTKNASQADLVFSGVDYGGKYVGEQIGTGDFNKDGLLEIAATDPNYNSGRGGIFVFTPTHGSSTLTINDIGNTSGTTISGKASDSTTVDAVEYSLDSGSWTSCTADDNSFNSNSENYSCTLTSSIVDGSHSVRVRSKNLDGIFMLPSAYTSASFTFDHTSPKVDWTDTSGNTKKYESQGGDNVLTLETLPTFTFSKSSDTTSGLTRYEIIVDGNTYITNIDPNKPSDKDYREDDDKYVKYDGDNNISVHAKKESDRLVSGKAYKWKVRAIDSAGNSTETSEKIIRVNTHQANFSGTWFPLTLLSLGNKDINFSSIAVSQIPSSLDITSTTPTFYGIAPVGTKVTLKIEKENDSNTGRDLVLTTTTEANESSRFGINITHKLDKQEYFINLSAVNPQSDYVELPEFKLNVGSSNILQNIENIFKPKDNNIKKVGSGNPTPTKKLDSRLRGNDNVVKKHCFLWMCW